MDFVKITVSRICKLICKFVANDPISTICYRYCISMNIKFHASAQKWKLQKLAFSGTLYSISDNFILIFLKFLFHFILIILTKTVQDLRWELPLHPRCQRCEHNKQGLEYQSSSQRIGISYPLKRKLFIIHNQFFSIRNDALN